MIELIRWSSRSFIFQAATAPASIAAAEASLRLIRKGYGREQLWANTRRFREGLASIGLPPAGSSPIVTVPARTAIAVRRAARALIDKGVFVPAITHPAVALDESRLRFTITASHTNEDIDYALAAVAEIKDMLHTAEETPQREVATSQKKNGFVELAASAERLKALMNGCGPRRVTIDAAQCPKILIESADASVSDSNGHSQLTLKGDAEDIAGILQGGSAVTLIERIAGERVRAEGDVSSLAWLCFAINAEAAAPIYACAL